MALAGGLDLILFVAGEPDPGRPSVREATVGTSARLLGSIVSPRLATTASVPATASADDSPTIPSKEGLWHLPPEQIHCINTVTEVAEREGRNVTVVDVDRSDGREALVARWVGPDNVLPLLVRPDGARIEGVENFVPSRLRKFIRGVDRRPLR